MCDVAVEDEASGFSADDEADDFAAEGDANDFSIDPNGRVARDVAGSDKAGFAAGLIRTGCCSGDAERAAASV